MDAPFRQLVRHFFAKFFDNEWAPPGGEVTSTVTHAVALLAMPGLLLPIWFITKYTYLWHHPSVEPLRWSWPHKYLFITLAMGVMGALAVFEWDSLFPDLKDFHILTPLPLRPAAMFAAQVAALGLFILLFSVAINGFSSFAYPFIAGIPDVAIAGRLRLTLGHVVAVFCASWFSFLTVVAAEGLLLLLLTPRAFRKASPYVQFSVLSLVAVLFLLYQEVAPYLPVLRPDNLQILRVLPTMWFLGLYEVVAGNQSPLFVDLARRALMAMGVVTVTAIATYVLAYRRHARRSLEAAPLMEGGSSWLSDAITRVVDRWVVRQPVERAVFHFLVQTLNRSSKHKLFLAIYAGVGCAVVFEGLVAFYSVEGPGGVYKPGPALLSIPLVLSLFLLSGMRLIFTVPAELGANWVFRIAESKDWRPVFSAIRKAMVLMAILPLFAALLPFYVILWGWTTAVMHALFGITLSVLLMEGLLATFRKIPFTCSYLPGKAKVSERWIAYWIFFAIYTYAMAALEQWLLRKPVQYAVFISVAMAAYALWRIRQVRWFTQEFELIYEEELEPVVRTLNLGRG